MSFDKWGSKISKRHRQLEWTEEDTRTIEQYKKDLAAGKVKVIDLTHATVDNILNARKEDFFCGNCECFDLADGQRKGCECPCHNEGGVCSN